MTIVRRVVPYLLAAICLIASAVHVWKGLSSLDRPVDNVAGWDQRMQRVREVLPADVYTVGYVEEADLPDSTALADEPEFFLTQYGVAPALLVRGVGPEWIIGNFGSGEPLDAATSWLDRELGKYTVQDLGFGVYLIHDTEN